MAIVKFEKNEAVISELKEFGEKVELFRSRKFDADEFKHRRLLQGIYGQRQPALFMIRVKIPGGNLDHKMLEGIALASEKFGKPVLHITTRQDIQLYDVKIQNIMPILEHLADYGLTTREASGATIRNIITSPFAGRLRNQVFDISPAMETFARFFMRHPDTQHLPRKFKISISDNGEDYAVSGMHDMGLIAVDKNGKKGFKVVIGGSLGSIPVAARTYSEFLEASEVLPHTLAILRAFNKHGDRSKRAEARLKFQLEKIGYDRFMGYVAEELKQLKTENYPFPEVVTVKPENEAFDFSNPFDPTSETEKFNWYKFNVFPSTLKNQYMILVRVPLGDLAADTARSLIEKHRQWSGSQNSESYITLADSQNLVLRGIVADSSSRKELFSEIYNFLAGHDLNRIGHRNFGDVVTCLGSATCSAGITHSPGLAKVLTDRFKEKFMSDDRYRDAVIHISGCANSCARHHLAALGFSGRADTEFAEGQHAPAYNVYFGGAALADGNIRIGRKASEKIHARRVPALIESVIADFEQNSNGQESFGEYLSRVSQEKLNSLVNGFTLASKPASREEELEFDWGKDTPYVMQYGEGECS